MRRSKLGLWWVGCSSLLLACSASPGQDNEQPARAVAVEPSRAAQQLLGDLRSRFTVAVSRPDPDHLPEVAQQAPSERTPLLRASQVEAFERREGWLVPRLPASAARGLMRPATVRLPERASGAFEVKDDKSGMRIAVQREGATDAAGEVAEGWVAYRAGVKGGDVLHLVHAEGTEDYVYFAEKPEREELRYRVDVSAVAGLRLVNNVLEMLDATGHPGIRIAAPRLLDATAREEPLEITVDGCAFDEQPAPPWGRPTLSPGASHCTIGVRWSAGLQYPLLIDPAFTSAGSLAVGRKFHTATKLMDGSVLVVGGQGNDATACPNSRCKTAELWQAGVFAAAGSLAVGRQSHSSSLLSDGSILITGGQGIDAVNCPSNFCRSAERWAAGTFSPAGTMTTGRLRHTASALADDSVLIAGGWGNDATACVSGYCKTAELWKAGTFSATGSLNVARRNHTASTLADGSVLVVGGQGNDATNCPSATCRAAEIWAAGTFTVTGSLAVGRYDHAAVALSNNSVLIVGGQGTDVTSCPSQTCKTAELWQGGAFSPAGAMALGRRSPGAAGLPDGSVLVVGGYGVDNLSCIGNSCKPAESWQSGAFAPAGSLAFGRRDVTATALDDGSVLVVGGTGTDATWCPNATCKLAERWVKSASDTGSACTASIQCSTGACVDGVCCDTTCAGLCQGCTSAKTGQPNGICAPIAAGTDPDNECKDDGSPACTKNGFCDGAGACQFYPSVDCSGQPCSTGTQCTSGFCADGVCCDSACTGLCVACSAALKGTGKDGLCEPIKDGLDPQAECATTGTLAPCQSDGVCNGAAACRASSMGLTCGSTACVDVTTQRDAPRCDAAAQCSQGGTTPCYPYRCQNNACAQSCSVNNGCQAPASCHLGKCIEPQDLGFSCTIANNCKSGFCVDGVCCESSCVGKCYACTNSLKGQGADGACEPIKDGIDPNNECGQIGVGVCQADGVCSGSGSCRTPLQGLTCGTSSCASITTQVNAAICDGNGVCIATGTSLCSPYACKGNACLTTCTTNDDCSAGISCVGGACAAPQPIGAACSVNPQCQSGYCVEGVCCDSACDGPCQSCLGIHKADGTSSGTCGAVRPDTDPKDMCEPSPSNPCAADGYCNGSGTCRTVSAAGKSCGDATCSANGTSVVGKVCNGAGACIDSATPISCGNYQCAAGSCNTTCASKSDCASGKACVGGACVEPLSKGQACSSGNECQSGFCVEGICCDGLCDGPCQSCKAELKGGVTGECGAVPSGTDPKDKCSTDPNNPCGADGTCGENGSCRPFATNATSCGATACNVAGNAVSGKLCDGNGACIDAQVVPCGDYRCVGDSCKQSCDSSADCVNGRVCIQKQCVAPLANGEACGSNADCQSSHCVESVCCDTVCDGGCESCLAGRKAGGATGECGAIKENTDPKAACEPDTVSVCGSDGLCDGAGTCRPHAKAGTACGAGNTCSNNSVIGQVCDAGGACINSPTGQPCEKYACKAGSCVSQCTSDDDCAAGNYCDAGSCQGKKATGDTCQSKAECTTGYCVEGFCCNKACDGKCESCDGSKKASGSSGECGPITAGTDPKGICTSSLSPACIEDKLGSPACDGNGTCALQPKSCSAHLVCKDDACPTSCKVTGDCQKGYRCDAGTCVEQTPPGQACAHATECSTGFCADGVCCDSPCNQQCAACAEPGSLGKCIAIDGGPRKGHPPCDGEGKCIGTCDGKKLDGCSFPEEGTTCQPSSCKGDVLTPTSTCDGAGKCVSKDPTDCGDYACDEAAGVCKKSCGTDSDCKAGAVCDMAKKQCAPSPGTCKDAFTVKKPDGTETPCSPYRCSNGVCRDSCTSAADCADGYTCKGGVCEESNGGTGGQGGSAQSGQGGSAQGGLAGASATMGGQGGSAMAQGGSASAAAPPAEAPAEEGGCGCRTVPTNGSRGALALAGLAMVVAARRRRSRVVGSGAGGSRGDGVGC